MPPVKRDSDPSSGVLDPHDINNAGFFFLFALIGVAFVLGGIWFFFWARDGGFYFRDDDWDDYKSTVLRRKGPNGTLLSNATRSTKLGGGSVFNKAYDRHHELDTRTEVTESTAMSGITAGPSDIYAREKREEKRRQREAERRKKRASKEKKKKMGKNGEEDEEGKEMLGLGVVDEEAEKMAREQLRNYREERPARVGGLNAKADGSEWGGSTTNAGQSRSTLSSGLSSAPTATEMASGLGSGSGSAAGSGVGASRPPGGRSAAAAGGIRKVYSVADRTTARENERLRAEARKIREEGRTAARRETRFQRSILPASASEMSESLLSGSVATGSGGGGGRTVMDEGGSDVGTKSYHHPMPELREHRRREREREREREGRARRGYQRGNTRDEELEEEVD